MNILIVNHYAGSPALGMEFRPYYLAREWVKAGHRARIIGATFSHLRQAQPSPGRQVIDGIEYEWIKAPPYEGNGVGRVRNIMAFSSSLRRMADDIAKDFKPHYVIASSTHPFDIYGARRIARQSGAGLVYEVHDLWPLSPMELGGMSRLHPFILAVDAADKTALRSADTVISILPKTRDYLVNRGMPSHHWFPVPNGVVVEDWNADLITKIPEGHASAIQAIRDTGKFIVGYAGSHGVANDLGTLIEAARSSAAHFVLVGKGPERDALMKSAPANVTFLDAVPKSSIPDLLSKFDTLYISLQKQPLFRFGISPNKLFDYMMSGKPIIQAIESGNDIVSSARCGITVEPGNTTAVSEAVTRMSGLSPDQRDEMGARGKSYVLSRHSYSILAQDFFSSMEYREPLSVHSY